RDPAGGGSALRVHRQADARLQAWTADERRRQHGERVKNALRDGRRGPRPLSGGVVLSAPVASSMKPSITPPFRAEQVGSLLRPPELLHARARARAGALSTAELREVEDRCIRTAVARQESLGLRVVTDGEFRRDFWHLDFLRRLDGVGLAPIS